MTQQPEGSAEYADYLQRLLHHARAAGHRNARSALTPADLDEIVAGLTIAATVTEEQARELGREDRAFQALVARAARFRRTKARVVRLRRAVRGDS